ncbi:MAG: hypothetical protein WD830_02840 [Chloroflexota bacterium]
MSFNRSRFAERDADRLGQTALDDALREALRGLIDDGTYLEILGRYGVEEVALTVRP